ncbi:MAG: helix-turn-helix domain-containing protein [Afipia sp.]
MTTKAPKFTPVTGEAALAMRKKTGLNQSRFWSVVGIGQSAGSRYESGRNIPRPVQMLLRIAYGTAAQSAKQVDALRPSSAQEAAE